MSPNFIGRRPTYGAQYDSENSTGRGRKAGRPISVPRRRTWRCCKSSLAIMFFFPMVRWPMKSGRQLSGSPASFGSPRGHAAAAGFGRWRISTTTPPYPPAPDVRACALKFELGRVPGNVYRKRKSEFCMSNATGDLGLVLPSYVFATPVSRRPGVSVPPGGLWRSSAPAWRGPCPAVVTGAVRQPPFPSARSDHHQRQRHGALGIWRRCSQLKMERRRSTN